MTDGTTAGTTLVKDIAVGSGGSDPENFYLLNGKMIFTASGNSTSLRQIYATDGTTAGTQALFTDCSYFDEDNIVEYQGNLYFLTRNSTATHIQLIKTNGTVPGTSVVWSIPYTFNSYSSGSDVLRKELGIYNNQLVWILQNANSFDVYSYNGSGTPGFFTVSTPVNTLIKETEMNFTNNKIFFAISPTATQQLLYVTDGTAPGTALLFTNTSTSGFDTKLNLPFVLNNEQYFTAYNTGNQQIYKTNGTVAGTLLVKDFGALNSTEIFNQYSYDEKILVDGNTAYFVTNTGSATTHSLWKTDGTTAGTVIIPSTALDVYPWLIEDIYKLDGNIYISTLNDLTGESKIYLFDALTNNFTYIRNETNGIIFNYTNYNENIMLCGGRQLIGFLDDHTRYQHEFLPNSLMPFNDKLGAGYLKNSNTSFTALQELPLFSTYLAATTFTPIGSNYLFLGITNNTYILNLLDPSGVDCSLLPLQFGNIKAGWLNKNAIITWQTFNEVNVKDFDIERSFNQQQWILIGKQAAHNTSNNNYSFTDADSKDGINYYRIKQIDKDGGFTYSKTVSLNKASINSITAYSSTNTINYTINGNGLYNVQLIDMNGRVIYKADNINAGVTEIINNKSPGIYVLKAIDKKGSILTKKILMN